MAGRLLAALVLGLIAYGSIAEGYGQTGLTIPSNLNSTVSSLIGSAASANTAWANLNGLSIKRLDSQRLAAGVDAASLLSQADQYAQVSAAAGAFVSKFPNDPHAAAAHKLEAMAALQAVQAGGSSYQADSEVLAKAYVADQSIAIGDRVDVGLADLQGAAGAKLNGKQLPEDSATFLAIADSLYAQFGGTPRVYDQYLNLLQTADASTASTLAQRLIAASGTPQGIKVEASKALLRCGLLGKTAPTLKTIDGSTVAPDAPGKITVILFWDATTKGAQLAGLSPLFAGLPSNVRWVYVAAGGGVVPSANAQNMAPIAGLQCFEPSQFGGLMMRTFGAPQLPYAYVTDSAGKVIGFGPASALNKLAALN